MINGQKHLHEIMAVIIIDHVKWIDYFYQVDFCICVAEDGMDCT